MEERGKLFGLRGRNNQNATDLVGDMHHAAAPFNVKTASKWLTRDIINHRVQELWNHTHQAEDGVRNWRRNLGRDHPPQHAGHAALHEQLTV